MNTLHFTKLEAIGNNFVLVDALRLPEHNWPLLARRMCVRSFGVGADGLLVLSTSDRADFLMRMFNPDGSEDACGNGLRCAAVYVHSLGLTHKDHLVFDAKDGIHPVEIVHEKGLVTARVNMRRPSFHAADIPSTLDVGDVIDYPLEVDGQVVSVTCVQIGTPHAVIFAPLAEFWDTMPAISRDIEIHPAFPEKISVTWCAVESPDSLRIRTWERAVGPTLGCGTGACSAMVAANIHGFAGEFARVTSPGGTLGIEWPGRGDVFMSGPAGIVFTGEWQLVGDEGVV